MGSPSSDVCGGSHRAHESGTLKGLSRVIQIPDGKELERVLTVLEHGSDEDE